MSGFVHFYTKRGVEYAEWRVSVRKGDKVTHERRNLGRVVDRERLIFKKRGAPAYGIDADGQPREVSTDELPAASERGPSTSATRSSRSSTRALNRGKTVTASDAGAAEMARALGDCREEVARLRAEVSGLSARVAELEKRNCGLLAASAEAQGVLTAARADRGAPPPPERGQ